MSYWVLTIFIGVVSILVFRFLSVKPKSGDPEPEENKDSRNEPLSDSPEKVVKWILKLEKSRTGVKV